MSDVSAVQGLVDALRECAAIGDLLQEQDNRLTSLPIFMVQRHRRTYGFDPQYTEDCVAWLHSDEAVEVTDEDFERLEAKWDESGEEPDGYTRTAYADTWENVMPFFTEKAAQRYIDENGHNLSSPRIFVESGYRNHEWEAIRTACIGARRALSTWDTREPGPSDFDDAVALLTAHDVGRYCGYDFESKICPMPRACWHHRKNKFITRRPIDTAVLGTPPGASSVMPPIPETRGVRLSIPKRTK